MTETAPPAAQISIHFITCFKLFYIFTNRFNSSCYVGAEYMPLRFQNTI